MSNAKLRAAAGDLWDDNDELQVLISDLFETIACAGRIFLSLGEDRPLFQHALQSSQQSRKILFKMNAKHHDSGASDVKRVSSHGKAVIF